MELVLVPLIDGDMLIETDTLLEKLPLVDEETLAV